MTKSKKVKIDSSNFVMQVFYAPHDSDIIECEAIDAVRDVCRLMKSAVMTDSSATLFEITGYFNSKKWERESDEFSGEGNESMLVVYAILPLNIDLKNLLKEVKKLLKKKYKDEEDHFNLSWCISKENFNKLLEDLEITVGD
jgi:hypothetical protein